MTSRHRYAILLSVCTFILLMAGAAVTSTKSSMAVPDWPLSFGQWMPAMVGGVAWEHGHRMIAALVGIIILGLALWSYVKEGSRAVRVIAWAALFGVVVQGLLGGLTVLWGTAQQLNDTNPVYSSIHGVLAMVVFSLVVTYAAVTAPGWTAAKAHQSKLAPHSKLPGLAHALLCVVFIQITFGAVIRQFNAGLAIPDFPLSFGKLIPDFNSWLIAVAYAHRVGALSVLLVGAVLIFKVFKELRDLAWVRRPAHMLVGLIFVQIILGAYTVLSGLQAVVATLHHAVGTLVLLFALIVALRLGRLSGSLNFESYEKPL